MGENSKIEWCTHTQNFWIGCTKVSPGCANCYAAVDTYSRVQRAKGRELWGDAGARHITSDDVWRQPLKWNAQAAAAGERPKSFVNSLSDFFEKRDDLVAPRARAWTIMRACTHVDFLLLTKRPENVPEMLPSDWGDGWPNIWLGTTAEDRKRAAERITELRRLPAVVRYVSFEPLLEDLGALDLAGIHWAIIGGESGPGARPFHLEWVRNILRQCVAAGVAPFVKQLGVMPCMDESAWRALNPTPLISPRSLKVTPGLVVLAMNDHRKGGNPDEWPADLRVRQFPGAPGAPTTSASPGVSLSGRRRSGGAEDQARPKETP